MPSTAHGENQEAKPRLRRRLSFESNFLAAIEDQSTGRGLNIGCCMETAGGRRISREEFAKLFKDRVSDPYPRYRSRVYSTPSFFGLDVRYNLEDLGEAFDVLSIVDEFEAAEVPRQSPGMTAVEAVIENIISTPFGDELPPIRFVLIHNEDGNTTVVSKLHHALADGASSIMALLELTDPLEKPGNSDTSSVGSTSASDGPGRSSKCGNSATLTLTSGLSVVWRWLKLVPWAIYMLLIFSVLPDSYTSLRPTLRKRGRSEVRCSKRVPLEDLKVISRATGAKVNDVILALLAGAARRYLLAEAVKKGKESSDPASLRMGFQFTANMRPSNGKTTIGTGGNESWVFSVPVSLHADIRERIRDAQLQTSRLKSSPAFLFGTNEFTQRIDDATQMTVLLSGNSPLLSNLLQVWLEFDLNRLAPDRKPKFPCFASPFNQVSITIQPAVVNRHLRSLLRVLSSASGRVFIRLCCFFMNLPFVRRLLIQSICGERYLLGKTLTVTNVPGPRDSRSVCGREVKGMQSYVSNPQTFTVVTYNGQMSTTIVTDAATVDAEMMRECYNTEVEQAIALFRSSSK